jgi:hypothetical protein
VPTSNIIGLDTFAPAKRAKRGKGSVAEVSNAGSDPSRKRNAAPAWSTGAAQFDRSIDNHEDASPGYHRRGFDASKQSELSDKLSEIERRARLRDRRARGAGRPAKRVRDIKAYFSDEHGEALPDDATGYGDFFILACHVARLNGDPERNIRRYAE